MLPPQTMQESSWLAGKQGTQSGASLEEQLETLSRDFSGSGASNYKVSGFTIENNAPCSTCKSWLSRKQLII